ncbi:MAG TPA: hypothetical protein VNM69_06450 [Bacillus sp. (in: firmicutes)]|nr:hypothetical protein [Bacillus sp. (in: firmicutes)]
MNWGRYHEIPYNSGLEEKIIGPFSFSKLCWIAPGVLVSYQIAQVFPVIPFLEEYVIFSRLHLTIPLIIAVIFAYFKDQRTNLTLFEMIMTKRALNKRRRTYAYKKVNWDEEGEEE